MTHKLLPIAPKLLPLLAMLCSGSNGEIEIVNSVRSGRIEESGADVHSLGDECSDEWRTANGGEVRE